MKEPPLGTSGGGSQNTPLRGVYLSTSPQRTWTPEETPPFLASTIELWLDRMTTFTGYQLVPVASAMVRINRRWEQARAVGDREAQMAALIDGELLLDFMYPTLPPWEAAPSQEVSYV